MKTTLTGGGVVAVVGVVVVGFAAFKLWKLAQNAGGAVVDAAGRVITHDLNPASSDNLINRGVNAVGQAATGDSGWSLGGAIYDWMNPGAFANNPTPFLSPDQLAAAKALYERPIDMGGGDGW